MSGSVKTRLKKLEHRIESNMRKAWYENGLCLLEIRDSRLYKDSHSTFEQYCRERWEMSERQAYRLVDAAHTYQIIERNSLTQNDVLGQKILPDKERHIRPLMRLESDAQRVHVWGRIAQTEEKVTGKVVDEYVDSFIANPEPVNRVEPIEREHSGISSAKAEVLWTKGLNDECYTPEYAVRALLPHLDKFRKDIVWCPFDREDSAFVRLLQEAGFAVHFSHIETGQDFYEYEPDEWGVLVSNPPFTNKRKIFERCLSFGKPFALVMSNTWLNDAAPKQVFKDFRLELLMFEERMKFLNQDNNENKITFSSSYFCSGVLEQQIVFDSLRRYGYGNQSDLITV